MMIKKLAVAVACALIGAVAVTGQPTGEDLDRWALAHWDAVGTGTTDAVVAGFSPEGGVAFLGTPWDGLYHGADTAVAWDAFFAGLSVRGAVVTGVVRAVAEARLVYGALELDTPEGTVVVESFLQFSPDGLLRAADYVRISAPNAVVPVADGQILDGEYARSAQDRATGVTLYWRNGLVVLFAALESPGTGWVSAGFDPERRMQGANYIIAAVPPAGLVIEDHFGSGPTSHRRDLREDILRAEGAVSAGRTVVEFVIPLDSLDAEDKPLVPGQTYTVLLAYHRSSTSLSAIHTARGAVQMTLEE